MQQLFGLFAKITGILGILLCAAAGIARVAGSYYLAGFEAMTAFTGGLGLMVLACLIKLEEISCAINKKP